MIRIDIPAGTELHPAMQICVSAINEATDEKIQDKFVIALIHFSETLNVDMAQYITEVK